MPRLVPHRPAPRLPAGDRECPQACRCAPRRRAPVPAGCQDARCHGPGTCAGHVVCWSASTLVPAPGSRARARTRTPWCRATAGDSPAASAGEAEAKDQAMMGAAGGRPARPSPSRRAEALAGCASADGSSWPSVGTVNAGQVHRSSRAHTRARVRAAVRHGWLCRLVRPGPSHQRRAGAARKAPRAMRSNRGQARRIRRVSRWAVAVAAVTVAGCGCAPGSPSRSGPVPAGAAGPGEPGTCTASASPTPGCGPRCGTNGRSRGTPGRWTTPHVGNRACA
jgi:hypothetical protein